MQRTQSCLKPYVQSRRERYVCAICRRAQREQTHEVVSTSPLGACMHNRSHIFEEHSSVTMDAMTIAAADPSTMSSSHIPLVGEQSALARKRRREILVGNVPATPDEVVSTKVVKIESDYSSDSTDSSRKSTCAKRPQMKYDPDVPMTKEETSAWRREERRKRNRESAAACRKRQRDRITELEDEVNDWKSKFDEALSKLRELEGSDNPNMDVGAFEKLFERCTTPDTNSTEDLMSPSLCVSSNVIQNLQGHVVSPCISPSFIPPITRPTVTFDLPVLEETYVTADQPSVPTRFSADSRVEKRQHLKEKITRPATSRLLTLRRRQLNTCFVCPPTQ